MTAPVPRAHTRLRLTTRIAGVLTIVALLTVAIGRDGRHVESTGPPQKEHPARIAFWGLAEHLGNRIVVLVHTSCQKVVGTTERPGPRADRLAVLVGGAADCVADMPTKLITLNLKFGGLGCNEGSPLVDAATDRTLALASGRSWPAFNCPAVIANLSQTRPIHRPPNQPLGTAVSGRSCHVEGFTFR